MCTDVNDCNDHGDCINEECSCDLGWNGSICGTAGEDDWGDGKWKTFIFCFTVLNGLLIVLAFGKLYMSMKGNSYIGVKRLLWRVLKSPKNLSLLSLGLVGVFKVLWLSIDPLRFKEITSRVLDRLLFESVYPLYFCIYASVLYVMAGLYQGMYSKRSDPFRIIRKILIVMIILGFPIQFVLSVVKGYRVESPTVFYLGYGTIAGASALVSVGFIIFGILMCCYIEVTAHIETQGDSAPLAGENRDNPDYDQQMSELEVGDKALRRMGCMKLPLSSFNLQNSAEMSEK